LELIEPVTAMQQPAPEEEAAADQSSDEPPD